MKARRPISSRAPILALVLILGACASRDDDTSPYIEELEPGTLSLRVGITQPSMPLDLEPGSDELGTNVNYEQNSAPKLGFGADYWIVGFFLSFASLGPAEDPEIYGRTSYFDLQFHLNYEHWLVDLYYQKSKGYHWDDSFTVLLRPDLRSAFNGVNVIYIFHPERVSFSAASSSTAIQLRNGGSWLLMANYGDQAIESDAVLAPAGFEFDYGRLGNMQRGRFYTGSVGGGYAYNGVAGGIFGRKWFFHGALLASIGPQFQRFDTRDFGSYDVQAFSAKTNLRGAVGYNTKSFYFGLGVIADGTTYEIDNKTLFFHSLFTSIFIGMRTNVGTFF